MQETQHTKMKSLGPEDPLEEEMATHSYIFFFSLIYFYLGNAMDREALQATVYGVTKS